jgi:WhiB family transcriptional regulator, redox-sensing transcriptional regulator
MTVGYFDQLPVFVDEGDPACRGKGVNPEWWFPPPGPDSWQLRQAKRICRGCALRTACAAWAIDTQQKYGIWGATTANERRRLNKCRTGLCGHSRCHRARLGGPAS